MSYACRTFRTALIIPFAWDDTGTTARAWLESLRARQIPARREGKEPTLLWQERDAGGGFRELDELTPSFRQVLGLAGDDDYPSPWRCARLDLTLHNDAVQRLLPRPRLWAGKTGKSNVVAEASFRAVQVLLFPLGAGLLVLHVDWLRPGAGGKGGGRNPAEWPSDEACGVLHLARHFRQEPLMPGWTFGKPPPPPEFSQRQAPTPAVYREDLGEAMLGACHGEEPVSLRQLAVWLLRSSTNPSPTVGGGRYVYHHSTVVLDSEPSEEHLHELAFHFRRAYGATYRAPPADSRGGNDVVLRPRANRLMGFSREGSASISWAPPGANPTFETGQWPSKFQGIYLQLALHVHSERLGLATLASRAGRQGADLLLRSADGVPRILSDPAAHRREIQALWLSMTQYTLTMPPADCGGPSEYMECFTALRRVYGIPRQLAELRQELKEFSSLVETLYQEEQQQRLQHLQRQQEEQRREAEKRHRQEGLRRDEQRAQQEQRYRQEKLRREDERRHHEEVEKQAAKRDKRLEHMLALIGAFAIPPAVLGGLYGMNNALSLPPGFPELDFLDTCVVTGVSILVLLLVYLVFTRLTRERVERVGTSTPTDSGDAQAL